METILSCIKYYFKPRYAVMKGIDIEDRAILFLGANAKYDSGLVKFSNHSGVYKKERIEKTIWTFEELIKWRRLLGKSFNSMQKINKKWVRIS